MEIEDHSLWVSHTWGLSCICVKLVSRDDLNAAVLPGIFWWVVHGGTFRICNRSFRSAIYFARHGECYVVLPAKIVVVKVRSMSSCDRRKLWR